MKTKSELKNRSWKRFNKPLVSQWGIGRKKSLAILLLAISAVAAFGQGKIRFDNSGRPVTLSSRWVLAVDMAFAGQPVPTLGGSGINLPSGILLNVALYAGAYPGSETLITTIPFSSMVSPDDGYWAPIVLTLPSGLPGGQPAWFTVYVYDAAYATAFEAHNAFAYFGSSGEFTMTPGFSPVSISSGGGTTWAPGDLWVPGYLDPPLTIQIVSQPTNQTVLRGATATFSVSAYTYCVCYRLTYEWLFNGTPIPGATNSSCQITNAQPTNAGVYSVLLWDGIVATSSNATLTVASPPPTITSSPQSQTAELGASVAFDVAATGDPPLLYQWFFNATAPLTAPSTNSSFQRTNVQVPASGAYLVVVTNSGGAVTSPPAMLNVIPAVARRLVPGLNLTAQAGEFLGLDYRDDLALTPNWQTMATMTLSNSSQFYFDLSEPRPPQRFYRAWQSGTPGVVPSLSLPGMVPAITLTGNISDSLRLDYINQFGPTDAWVTLGTVTLTNTSQLYFDTSSLGQPARLWRIVPVP